MKRTLQLLLAGLITLLAVACSTSIIEPPPNPVTGKAVMNSGSADYYGAVEDATVDNMVVTFIGSIVAEGVAPEDVTIKLEVMIPTQSSTIELPSGNYMFTLISIPMAHTIVKSASNTIITRGTGEKATTQQISGGTMTVSSTGNVYTITGRVDDAVDGSISFSFTGLMRITDEREPEPEPDPDPATMTKSHAHYISSGSRKPTTQYIVELTTDDYDGQGLGCVVSLDLSSERSYFPMGMGHGEYIFGGTSEDEFAILSSENSFFMAQGSYGSLPVAITEGSIIIERYPGNDDYGISGVVKGAKGEFLEFSFREPLNMKEATIYLDKGNSWYTYYARNDDVVSYMFQLYNLDTENFGGVIELVNGPGDFMMFWVNAPKGSDPDVYEYVPEFIANGTYTYAHRANMDDEKAWDIPYAKGASQVEFIKKNGKSVSDEQFASGALTLSSELIGGEHIYTITGDIVTVDDITIHVNYHGKIALHGSFDTRPWSDLEADRVIPDGALTQAIAEDWGTSYSGNSYERGIVVGTPDFDLPNTDGGGKLSSHLLALVLFNEAPYDYDNNLVELGDYKIDANYTEKAMTIEAAYSASTMGGSWWMRSYNDGPAAAIKGVEKFNISKVDEDHIIDFVLLDDHKPPFKVIGKFVGKLTPEEDYVSPLSRKIERVRYRAKDYTKTANVKRQVSVNGVDKAEFNSYVETRK